MCAALRAQRQRIAHQIHAQQGEQGCCHTNGIEKTGTDAPAKQQRGQPKYQKTQSERGKVQQHRPATGPAQKLCAHQRQHKTGQMVR